ncbi:uncharacterized protein [Clytia hemisphaerica]|uniref:Cnidarian restricted protein n=1 Tax=Clytia hemisphaerica TaxID=252671 RepID=A0A7M5UHY1_9CNID
MIPLRRTFIALTLLVVLSCDGNGASSTSVTKVTNHQQNNKTGVLNHVASLTCAWSMYPDVKFTFEVPQHWADHYRNVNLTKDMEEKSGLNVYMKSFDKMKFTPSYDPKWEKIDHCNRMSLIYGTRYVVCIITYVSRLLQHKQVNTELYYKFKLVYDNESFNQTVENFRKMPEGHTNRTVLAQDYIPVFIQENIPYDISPQDLFRCLGDIKPELILVGSCESLALHWYRGPELYSFRYIHQDRLEVRRSEDSQLIIYKNNFFPEVTKYLHVLNITELIISDTWYTACIKMDFGPGWLDPALYNVTRDGLLVTCKRAYTACSTEKTLIKKPLLTIEWTSSLLILMTFCVIILLVVIYVQYKRHGSFTTTHAHQTEDENYLIQPIEQRTLIGERQEAHFIDSQPYTYIDQTHMGGLGGRDERPALDEGGGGWAEDVRHRRQITQFEQLVDHYRGIQYTDIRPPEHQPSIQVPVPIQHNPEQLRNSVQVQPVPYSNDVIIGEHHQSEEESDVKRQQQQSELNKMFS